MTSEAQAALRRIIENYSRVTRFCLICNYVSRIIDPLASRCAKFRFKPLYGAPITDKLNQIIKAENISITPKAVKKLIEVSKGDMRKSITYLQSLSLLHTDSEITHPDVVELSGVIPDEMIAKVLQVCSTNCFLRLQFAVNEFIMEGYSANEVLSQLQDKIISSKDFGDKEKANICLAFSEADEALVDGSDEYYSA
eukprot:CAMPEP_0174276552 /NCGR_PEP_ID=MMETSP0439-20130205/60453_1 /TAXON_ID=0 /ORGANISM="Stereomyxa ramosa, Strain Chinc5" /LENGTH=195 /DNA_ID=CAMNT_0015368797 /DNA_START=722 /DNA_END=1310 /DNA_ORIENTATION=+